jgi:PEGA domain
MTSVISHRNIMLVLLASTLLGTGCVHRRLTVVSEPAGATVYVDQQQIGQTPVSTPFTYYGTREIVLEKDGFQTVKEMHKIRPPWYQLPPFDFISDNFWPFRIRDERVLDFQLSAEAPVDEIQLQQRADQLRSNVQQGLVLPTVSQQTVVESQSTRR